MSDILKHIEHLCVNIVHQGTLNTASCIIIMFLFFVLGTSQFLYHDYYYTLADTVEI